MAIRDAIQLKDPVHQLCRAPADSTSERASALWRRRHVLRAECMLVLAVVGQKRCPNTTVHTTVAAW